jgi:molybdopterin molybdotransferase
MEIEIELTQGPIAEKILPPSTGAQGAWLEFRGVVRGEENGQAISALEYEAYPEMAAREIRRLLGEIFIRHPCLAAKIIHRIGTIPVGETAIYVGVASAHRSEGIALLAEFMDQLKQDVPIWKRRTLPVSTAHSDISIVSSESQNPSNASPSSGGEGRGEGGRSSISLDDALAKIFSRRSPLPAVRLSLQESLGRTLRETVCAPDDLPDADRSTRDGYAILESDNSETFRVVDTLHAADWKPRQLKVGETVRIATGASLPCGQLRVVMQENVERDGDKIRIAKSGTTSNVRRRGEEVKAGVPLVQAGVRLDAGKLALLASAGCVQPLVSPRLRIVHYTTGDEVIPPHQTPAPGQIRDSNSILIRGLLQNYLCDLTQSHLPENFEAAKQQMNHHKEALDKANVVLISGGASVGDKDYTRPLLESLGFEIVVSQVAIRPGRPLIFGVNGSRIAFGLPGNPLSHFVCFHLFVAAALAKLCGAPPGRFLRGRLSASINDPNPRETLWPARLECAGANALLHPLKWSSSGDLTCLAETGALIRVPPNSPALAAGAEVDFLPAGNNYFA